MDLIITVTKLPYDRKFIVFTHFITITFSYGRCLNFFFTKIYKINCDQNCLILVRVVTSCRFLRYGTSKILITYKFLLFNLLRSFLGSGRINQLFTNWFIKCTQHKWDIFTLNVAIFYYVYELLRNFWR